MTNNLSLSDAQNLVAKYGSPLFITLGDVILANSNKYKSNFSSYRGGFSLAYSVKSNPMVALLQIFRKEGVLAEVCSLSDMTAAILAGYRGKDIIFDGLVKTEVELEKAIRLGIKIINIESFGESKRLERITNKIKKRVKVGIRLAFPSSKVGLKSLLGVSYDRFGVDRQTDELQEIVRLVVKSKYLDLVGLHVHTGSNQKSIESYFTGIDELISFMVRLRDDYGIRVKLLNLGGGLGVEGITAYKITDFGKNALLRLAGQPLRYEHTHFDFKLVSRQIIKHLEGRIEENNLAFPLLMMEPGRSLVGNSTHLIATIVDIKKSKHNNWMIIDAGTNLMPVLTLYSEYHDIVVLSKVRKKRKISIAGPLLYSSDIIASNRLLPQGRVGDLVVIKNVGAYFNCQANQFLYPRAATVLIENGRSRVIQRRETVRDLFVRDVY